ncbi:hypothetical protein TrVE_jg11856 [Triparma verrucosa]|uniref:pantothenate kinase n=1 Tax=Triparma verrucosa TaxID=1606542 RepID=A0A9W7C794_9STRA|nr:hypothetical protein TrVE_jg11856 [Triparma verrucosa]
MVMTKMVLQVQVESETPATPPTSLQLLASNQTKNNVDIGSIFGLDVGGTLSKLVYFEKSSPHSNSHTSPFLDSRRRQNSDIPTFPTSPQTSPKNPPSEPRSKDTSNLPPPSPTHNHPLKRINSLNSLHRHSHRAALDEFYKFANEHNTFGQSGIKEPHLSFQSRSLGGSFHFIHFETRHMPSAIDLISENGLAQNIKNMGCTGGGAHKYSEMWRSRVNINMIKQAEMASLVAGIEFVLKSLVGECFTFKPQRSPVTSSSSSPRKITEEEWSRKVQRDSIRDRTTYPYIVVSIGTGVSFIRVDGPGPSQFERVTGSTIGGGTYWGLCRLLTDCETFSDVLQLAEMGDSGKVDMLVKDIYGTNPEALRKLKLPGNIVASSFGKLATKNNPSDGIDQKDLARAILMMTTNNIAHIAYLTARLYKTSRIYFIGNFLRHNNVSCQRLSYSIDYWSNGTVEGLFLEHEGYLGALGAFLLGQEGGEEVKPMKEKRRSRRRSQSAGEAICKEDVERIVKGAEKLKREGEGEEEEEESEGTTGIYGGEVFAEPKKERQRRVTTTYIPNM